MLKQELPQHHRENKGFFYFLKYQWMNGKLDLAQNSKCSAFLFIAHKNRNLRNLVFVNETSFFIEWQTRAQTAKREPAERIVCHWVAKMQIVQEIYWLRWLKFHSAECVILSGRAIYSEIIHCCTGRIPIWCYIVRRNEQIGNGIAFSKQLALNWTLVPMIKTWVCTHCESMKKIGCQSTHFSTKFTSKSLHQSVERNRTPSTPFRYTSSSATQIGCPKEFSGSQSFADYLDRHSRSGLHFHRRLAGEKQKQRISMAQTMGSECTKRPSTVPCHTKSWMMKNEEGR